MHDKMVCLECLTDEALIDRLRDSTSPGVCDYCEMEREAVAEAGDLLAMVEEALQFAFGDPNDEPVPYDGREGGWQGSVIDGWDMFMDAQFPTEFDVDGQILQDLAIEFSDRQFCQKHFGMATEDEAMSWSWEEFCEIVKHQSRYFFRSMEIDEFAELGGEIAGAKFLDHLPGLVLAMGLVRTISTPLFRSRIVGVGEQAETASALGTPRTEYAKYSNRMSPAGVPMFYGGFDTETAEAETLQAWDGLESDIVTGEWRPVRDLNVLDLSASFAIPSVFDLERRKHRRKAIFLRKFAREIARPVPKDGLEHINYAPTQIVTEFFRFIFPKLAARSGNRLRLDGIRYPSSLTKGKTDCVVLFAEPHECINSGDESTDAVLELDKAVRRRLEPRETGEVQANERVSNP